MTATRPGYTTATGSSATSADVAPGVFKNSAPPTISGVPQVGRELTASPGTWSPAANYAYRWLVAGQPITGATAAAYTPTADDLRKTVTVQVTASQAGYTSATLSSAATQGVSPGTFLNTRDPAVVGTAKVGVPLTADPGTWSPEATFDYQWLSDGTAIQDAVAPTFTPTGAEYGHKLSVRVAAMRRGYLTALVTSPQTAATLPGTITQVTAPAISGRPVVGRTLTATAGTWNITPQQTGYQWLADGVPISGATTATYAPTQAVLDKRLTVRVTVGSPGYQTATGTSVATGPVVLGQTAFAAPPTLSGRVVFGETLTVSTSTPTPAEATPSYQWFRGTTPIAHATGSLYQLRAADVGSFISVRVILAAPHWESSVSRVRTETRVLSVPKLAVRDRVSGHRVTLGFIVYAPGIDEPGGVVHIFDRGVEIASARIVDGHGHIVIGPLASGRHRLGFRYDGGWLMTPYRTSKVIVIG